MLLRQISSVLCRLSSVLRIGEVTGRVPGPVSNTARTHRRLGIVTSPLLHQTTDDGKRTTERNVSVLCPPSSVIRTEG